MEIAHSPIGQAALYLAQKRHVPFEWGKHDCNTFVVEFHDLLYNTDHLKKLKGKYSTLCGAIRFIKRTLNAQQWFHSAGYYKADQPQDLDIMHDGFRAWLVFQGFGYTVAETGTLVRQPINKIEATVWRSKIWAQH